MRTLLAFAVAAATMAPIPAQADDVHAMTTGLCRFGTMWVITGDWDGDGRDGVGFVDASGSALKWTLRNGLSAGAADKTFTFGETSAAPLVGNWDGKGGDGIGTVDTTKGTNLQWQLRNSASAGAANTKFSFGPSNSRWAVAGDWDGKNGAGIGIAVQTASSLEWRVRDTNDAGSPTKIFSFGARTELVEAGNWDGKGGDGIATATRGTNLGWKLRDSVSAGSPTHAFDFGNGKFDCPLTGDWNGDGKDTVGVIPLLQDGDEVVREWQLRNSNSAGAADISFRF